MKELLFYLSPIPAGLAAAGFVIFALETRNPDSAFMRWYKRPKDRLKTAQEAAQ